MDIYVLILLVGILIYLARYILLKNLNFWKDRNVPYMKPLPLFGNYKDSLLLKKHMMLVAHEICQKFPNEPYIGSFFGTDPALIIQDPSLIKIVMTRDFHWCSGREVSDYSHREVTTHNRTFSAGDYWKVIRTNLTPLFSSAKLKNMFYLIKECADTLDSLLELEVKTNSEPDKKKLLIRYTMDCVTACALGVKSETMKNNDDGNVFSSIGNKIFEVSSLRGVKILCRSMWPSFFYGLGFTLFPNEVGTFFNNFLTDIFKTREGTKSSKNDFIDLILTWKKLNHISGDSMDNFLTKEKKTVNIDVTEELLASQCIVFFAAGFETTATTTSLLLYELAKNRDAQTKLIKEVDDYFKNNNSIDYDCVNSLPYVEACIEESQRLHPIVGLLTREVRYDYTLPTGLLLKKGTRIHIPVYHLHHNPEYFPEPEKFRPERFFGEERNKIKSYTFLPFGDGPRVCLGMRFAKMPMYTAILTIFKKYRVELGEGMPTKINYSPKSNVTQSSDGFPLKFIPRT